MILRYCQLRLQINSIKDLGRISTGLRYFYISNTACKFLMIFSRVGVGGLIGLLSKRNKNAHGVGNFENIEHEYRSHVSVPASPGQRGRQRVR